MPIVQRYAEDGTEHFLPYAAKKLRELHEYLTRSGIRAFNKRVDVDDGTVIYLSARMMGNGQFVDRVRITGGGHKYIVLLSISPELVDHGDVMTPLGSPTGYFGEIASRLPLHGSIQFSYSYTDADGVEHTKIFGTASSSGLGFAWNAGSPTTTQDITTATLVGTHLGLPLYAAPATGPGAITPVYGPHIEYTVAKTLALTRQLSGSSALTAALHDQIFAAYPARSDGNGYAIENVEVSFYYVSTESSVRVWGAFGARPAAQADGDEKQYLVPLVQVTYKPSTREFVPKDPNVGSVLRNPVKDGALAAWDWANLIASDHLQRPVGSAEWGYNVVGVFYPRTGDGEQSRVFREQEVEVQTALSEYPAAMAAPMRDFVAAGTPQPTKYPIPPPA